MLPGRLPRRKWTRRFAVKIFRPRERLTLNLRWTGFRRLIESKKLHATKNARVACGRSVRQNDIIIPFYIVVTIQWKFVTSTTHGCAIIWLWVKTCRTTVNAAPTWTPWLTGRGILSETTRDLARNAWSTSGIPRGQMVCNCENVVCCKHACMYCI